mgnify:CR=1 FL=1
MTLYLSFLSFSFFSRSLSLANNQTNTSIQSLNKIHCYSDLNIFLNNNSAKINCGKEFYLNYDDFSNYQFVTYNCPIYFHKNNIEDYTLKDKMEKIIQSLNLTKRKDVFLVKFLYYGNYNEILSYIYFFKYDDIELWMIFQDNDSSFYRCNETDFEIMENAYADLKWRFACLNNKLMLHYYNNNETIEMIIVPKNTAYFMIFYSLLTIFLIYISNCIIANCKTYKKQIENESP